MTEFNLEYDLHEFKGKIEPLKLKNNHFAKITDNYTEINMKIAKMEKSGHFSDDELDNLRKQRLEAKDEIVSMLKKSAF